MFSTVNTIFQYDNFLLVSDNKKLENLVKSTAGKCNNKIYHFMKKKTFSYFY